MTKVRSAAVAKGTLAGVAIVVAVLIGAAIGVGVGVVIGLIMHGSAGDGMGEGEVAPGVIMLPLLVTVPLTAGGSGYGAYRLVRLVWSEP